MKALPVWGHRVGAHVYGVRQPGPRAIQVPPVQRAALEVAHLRVITTTHACSMNKNHEPAGYQTRRVITTTQSRSINKNHDSTRSEFQLQARPVMTTTHAAQMHKTHDTEQ